MSEERILPTREQIEAMSDVSALEALREDIERSVKKIEADLEYRSDGDLDWERRACGALAYHRMCLGQLSRRIARLTGRTQANVAEQAALKAAKAQRHANTLEAQAQAIERKRLALEEAKLKADRQRDQAEAQRLAALDKRRGQALSNIQDLDWNRAFVRVARQKIAPELYAEISDEASRIIRDEAERQIRAAVSMGEAA